MREAEVPAFKERLLEYLVKAAREAKVHTSWLDPDDRYEKALRAFASSILEPDSGNRFLQDFKEFQKITAFYGALNSLAQVLLKAASPGVPDFYQLHPGGRGRGRDPQLPGAPDAGGRAYGQMGGAQSPPGVF